MEDYSEIIQNTFVRGSVRDAQFLFETCIRKAFPTSNYRRLELISVMREDQFMEGRSWNHVFDMHKDSLNGMDVWYVHCKRVTLGSSPDKQVYLDFTTLDFIQYA